MAEIDLNDLADRVEKLEGPSRETDELIADALFERSHFAQLADAPIGTGCMMWWQDGHQQSALRYTGSLDAAMTLVPEGWSIRFTRAPRAHYPARWSLHRPGKSVPAVTEDMDIQALGYIHAATLTAAALRARLMEGEGEK